MRALAIAAIVLVGALHVLTSVGNPVGAIEDDAVQVLLARSLRHGAFALPDARGVPITDPLPGLAALLALPVALVEPHWGALRLLFLAAAFAAALLTWRLARGLLPPRQAAAAALLAAASPSLVNHAGLVIPDLPLLALSLWLVEALPRAPFALLAGGAAFAALLRPQGALLAFCLGSSFLARSPRKAAVFWAWALAPLALWTARNRLLAGTATGYVLNWRAQVSLLAEPASALAHAKSLLASFFSEGLLGVVQGPQAARAALGLLAAAAAAAGAARLMRGKSQPSVFAMSAYAILVLALHATWVPIQARYVILLAPFLWIFLCASLPWPLLGLAALAMLRFDAGRTGAGLRRESSFKPRTMEWIRANTPPDARVQSFRFNAVTLLAGRNAWLPPFECATGPQWVDNSLASGLDYAVVESAFAPGGFLPPEVSYVGEHLLSWARETPGVSEVYRDEGEKTAVFKLSRTPSKTPGSRPAKPPRT